MNPKRRSKTQRDRTSNSVGGDVIKVKNVGSGAAVAAGRGAVAGVFQSPNKEDFERWRTSIEAKLNALPSLSDDERADANEQIQKIEQEAAKGRKADPSRLEKLINTLAVMSTDIFEVAIATLASPLSGIGLVLKKVGDKAKVEPEKK